MDQSKLEALKRYYAMQCGINATIELSTLRKLIALAERTTSPVQVEELSTHEVIGKIIDQMSQLQMLWGLNEPGALVRFREVSDVLFAASRACRPHVAAAAPHAQQPVAEQCELPQAMLNAFLGAVPEFTRDQVDQPNDEGRANWRAIEDDAVLANCIRAAIAASQPHDADAAKRLRLICKLLGIESHVPADDETLWGAAFAVLGQIRAALEARQQAAEPVAWLSAVASCVSSGHATTEAAKHLLMVIESDGLPKFPAIQQPQPAVEREIPVGEKGWRPACCDHAKGAACCDIGYCIADKERAELAQQPQDERAAFEAWAAKEFGAANFVQGNSGGYVNSKLHLRWEAWQARAALAKKGGA